MRVQVVDLLPAARACIDHRTETRFAARIGDAELAGETRDEQHQPAEHRRIGLARRRQRRQVPARNHEHVRLGRRADVVECDEFVVLVHLRAAGLLENVTGIVFGQLSLDRSEEDEFEDFLLDLIADLDVPVLMDFPAGHENPNLTIPFGTEVELVVEEQRGWITYREDALLPAAPNPRQDEGV